MTEVTVAVQYAAGTAYFALRMGCCDRYENEFQTVLLVDFEHANMKSCHELYRQRAQLQVHNDFYRSADPTRPPQTCLAQPQLNPASNETRHRALEALGFATDHPMYPGDVGAGAILDACRGTMWLPFLSKLTHSTHCVKPDAPLEWWMWLPEPILPDRFPDPDAFGGL